MSVASRYRIRISRCGGENLMRSCWPVSGRRHFAASSIDPAERK